MNFAIVVHGAPYSAEASHSALHFIEAALAAGHGIYRVFFYHDGVYNASALLAPPQDEWDLGARWQALADANIDLVVCIASSLRRGVLDETEADRYEKVHHNVAGGFVVSGLGQLIDATLNADRTITFGA
ncbi:MAG: sulfurtransferase complex subunit TusD [Pseudomonadota bacterium]